jgi:pilus assembly protein FimV
VGVLRNASLRALFVAASLLCAGAETFAAGLGRLEVLSALGAPLRAEIGIIADKNEIESLSAKMAPPAAFQNAGLIYSGAVAEMRVAIDKRANGEPYLSITTTKALNEPVVDLLIELSWSSGRVIREYTAFIDPPHLVAEREKQRQAAATAKPTTSAAPPQPAPKPEPLPETPAPQPEAPAAQPEAPIPTTPTDVAAEATPEPAAPTAPEPSRPVETIGGTAPTLLSAGDSSSMPSTGGESYGPTKRGDTLSKIALAAKPADVTLEQMLVLLFRSNPDAFSGKNMNRLKTGKIIRLPDPAQYGGISATDARKEVRLQSADWRAYRERLAAKAAQESPMAPEAQQAVAGQVTPKVEDKAASAGEPKDVVKLSKGEAGAAGAGATAADRSKALEEELVARDKALKESNERVAKLEKTIKDLQALVEVKNQGMAELQRQAAAGTTPAKPPASASPQPAAKPAQPGGAPATSTQPAPTAQPQTPPAAQPTAPPTAAQTTPPAPQAAPKPAAPPATPAPQAAPPPAQKPRPKPAPPPPPEPSLLDTVLSQPLYLVAGVLVVGLLGLVAVRTVRRRRESKSKSDEVAPAISALGAAGAGRTLSPTETDVGLAARSRDVAEDVDPLEEAEIFLAYGRDAQAEELLKEAIAANPRRYEIHAKLLEIYARRKDTKSFEQLAREVQQGTGGQGEAWSRVVALGYQIDPQNPRYAAGRGAAVATEDAVEPSAAERVDLEVGLGGDAAESSTGTDIDLGDTVRFERTQILSPGEFGVGEATEPAAAGVDLNIDLPPAGPGGGAEPSAPSSNTIDFDFDIAGASPGEPAPAPASSSGTADSGLDFDIGSLSLDAAADTRPSATTTTPSIDLSGISLDLGGATTTSPSASALGKDEKWYEVQTKFDLAKAYQEMGDKDGAREILKEVIAEGDAEQKAAAQAVLASLE